MKWREEDSELGEAVRAAVTCPIMRRFTGRVTRRTADIPH